MIISWIFYYSFTIFEVFCFVTNAGFHINYGESHYEMQLYYTYNKTCADNTHEPVAFVQTCFLGSISFKSAPNLNIQYPAMHVRKYSQIETKGLQKVRLEISNFGLLAC